MESLQELGALLGDFPSYPLWKHYSDNLFTTGSEWLKSDCTLQLRQISTCYDEGTFNTDMSVFTCAISGCMKTFHDNQRYESHYNAAHRNVCSTCRRIFPSLHLLDLHVQETHDSLFAVLSETRPMFRCLVDTCPMVNTSAESRRRHLVKEHHYPPNFRFHSLQHSARQKKNPSTSQQTMSAGICMETEPISPRKEPAADCKPSLENSPPAECAPVLAPARKFVYKVPGSVTFGSGVSRGFRGRGRGRGARLGSIQNHRSTKSARKGEESAMDLSDLTSALDD